jgi:hypothetical protein
MVAGDSTLGKRRRRERVSVQLSTFLESLSRICIGQGECSTSMNVCCKYKKKDIECVVDEIYASRSPAEFIRLQ